MSRFNVNDMIDDIVKEQRKKVRAAVKKAETVAKKRIEELIPEKMTEVYYGEYDPRFYTRTNQLIKSVGPYAEIKESGNVFSLNLGVEDENPFGPGAMSHRKGKKRTEEGIFEDFLAGIHPHGLGIGSDFQGTNIEENMNQALEDLIDNELLPIIESAIG
jgi:hypothetical protein